MSKPLRVCRDCGLEAWTKEDLEFFQNDKGSKHGKRNLCKECTSKYMKGYERKPPKPKTPYLRKCSRCGLEAYTEEDLERFRYVPSKPYQRDTWCKDCFNEWQRPRHYQRVRRNKIKNELIATFPKPLKCYFCGGLITLLTGRKDESLAIHSLDGNHDNWDPPNKTPAHRGCHSRWHSTGDRNPKRRNKKEGKD